MLPVTLHQYFFFDGERIEQIVRSEQRLEIAEATKTLLGVEVLTRSIKHLKEAKKTLESELENIGDSETKKLLWEQNKLEKESETIDKRQLEITQELRHKDELKKTLSNRLIELKGAKELQKLRDELEARSKLIIGQLKQAKDTLKKAISTRGYMVFISGATKEFRSIVDDLREKGELPVGIKRQFVSDLLDEKRCICGADLVEGTHAHHEVSAWMDKA